MTYVPFSLAVKCDLWRSVGGHGFRKFLKAWITDPSFRPVFSMRVCQLCNGFPRWLRVIFFPMAWVWHQRQRLKCAVDIPWALNVGPGLKLLHGVGIVVNADAKLGRNVTIMQGVTIGGSNYGFPTIEDDVIVCANSSIIGKITLGKGCVIGAGAVVLCDVPEAYNAVGNPARIFPRKSSPKGYYPLPKEF